MILESLSLGVPVVSVDCESGPKELIAHGSNGLLVENNNTKALAEAMNQMYANEVVYDQCRQNTKKSVQSYGLKSIGLKWQAILK
jgi:glycosyltransferase involved in cell wall biosynthesis